MDKIVYPRPNTQKRYFQFSEYLKTKFGKKVYKITLDAGFCCPNRDGTISTGGCIFCDDGGSFSRAHSGSLSVSQQVFTGIETLSSRFKAQKFMAYFQAYSNTYKPVDELKTIYDSALCHKDVVGLSIGTRPDCVDNELQVTHRIMKRGLNMACNQYTIRLWNLLIVDTILKHF